MIGRIAAIAAIVGLAAGAGAARAQDWTLDPAYGTTKLAAGFDVHTVALLAGGPENAANNVGGDCVGFVAEAPDLRVVFTAGTSPLVFSVESETDTTLVVNGPDGNWLCNDDSRGTLNPTIVISGPMSGQYDIWVGTFCDAGFADAVLTISEEDTGLALDWSLTPNYGTIDLTAGFTPDPFAVDIAAGGDVDARMTDDNCRGFASAAPDLRLNYTAGDFPLFFSVEADADTTLIISDPFGAWICDDDSGPALNPQIAIGEPQSGQYDIWIGTYSAGPTSAATLFISEIAGQSAGELNWDLDPNYGTAVLVAGFTPDPLVVELAAGGDVPAEVVGDNCRGFVTSAPDYRIQYEAGGFPLIFYVEADADTTLVIADPNGNWFCNDDTNGLNPEVAFAAPLDGTYDIWVGTYSDGANSPATLFVTEIGDGGTVANGTLDWALPPVFGEVDLLAGFLPDPHSVELTAGGNIQATSADPSCVGMVTAAPSYRLYYEAGTFPLYVWVNADADTTLVISDPSGNWICDDDGGAVFLSPALGWGNPPSGQYDIWVGTYGGAVAPATLNISETIDGRAADTPPPSPVPLPPSPPPPVNGPAIGDNPLFIE